MHVVCVSVGNRAHRCVPHPRDSRTPGDDIFCKLTVPLSSKTLSFLLQTPRPSLALISLFLSLSLSPRSPLHARHGCHQVVHVHAAGDRDAVVQPVVVGQPGHARPAVAAIAQEGGSARAVQGELGAQVPVHQAGPDLGDHEGGGGDEARDPWGGRQESGQEERARRDHQRAGQGAVRVARPGGEGRPENQHHNADVVCLFNPRIIRPDVGQRRQQVRGGGAQAEGAERVVRPGPGAVGAREQAGGGEAGQGEQTEAKEGQARYGVRPDVDALVRVEEGLVETDGARGREMSSGRGQRLTNKKRAQRASIRSPLFNLFNSRGGARAGAGTRPQARLLGGRLGHPGGGRTGGRA